MNNMIRDLAFLAISLIDNRTPMLPAVLKLEAVVCSNINQISLSANKGLITKIHSELVQQMGLFSPRSSILCGARFSAGVLAVPGVNYLGRSASIILAGGSEA